MKNNLARTRSEKGKKTHNLTDNHRTYRSKLSVPSIRNFDYNLYSRKGCNRNFLLSSLLRSWSCRAAKASVRRQVRGGKYFQELVGGSVSSEASVISRQTERDLGETHCLDRTVDNQRSSTDVELRVIFRKTVQARFVDDFCLLR